MDAAQNSLIHELDGDRFCDQSALDTAFEEEANGASATVAVVQCPVVHVHADEGIGHGTLEPARVLHRMVQRAGPVLQAIRDAITKVSRDLPRQVLAEVFADDVAAEWQREAGLYEPPLA